MYPLTGVNDGQREQWRTLRSTSVDRKWYPAAGNETRGSTDMSPLRNGAFRRCSRLGSTHLATTHCRWARGVAPAASSASRASSDGPGDGWVQFIRVPDAMRQYSGADEEDTRSRNHTTRPRAGPRPHQRIFGGSSISGSPWPRGGADSGVTANTASKHALVTEVAGHVR